jgi:acyl dehydratase
LAQRTASGQLRWAQTPHIAAAAGLYRLAPKAPPAPGARFSFMSRPSEYYFDDFAAGQVFTSQRRTITESDVVSFANWSWDTNPPHTDAVFGAQSRFGQRIAHGVLGLSVAMGLASRIGVFEQCSIALLNVDGWTFQRPLLIGDSVYCRVEIESVRLTSKGDAGILSRRFSLVNQHDEVVQDGRIDLMVSRRPPSVE